MLLRLFSNPSLLLQPSKTLLGLVQKGRGRGALNMDLYMLSKRGQRYYLSPTGLYMVTHQKIPQEKTFTWAEKSKCNRPKRAPNEKSLGAQSLYCWTGYNKQSYSTRTCVNGISKIIEKPIILETYLGFTVNRDFVRICECGISLKMLLGLFRIHWQLNLNSSFSPSDLL